MVSEVLVNFKDGSFKDRWLPLWNQSSICIRAFRKPIQAAENEKFSYSTQEGRRRLYACNQADGFFTESMGSFGGTALSNWLLRWWADTAFFLTQWDADYLFLYLLGPQGKKSVYFKKGHTFPLWVKWNQGDTHNKWWELTYRDREKERLILLTEQPLDLANLLKNNWTAAITSHEVSTN